MIKKITFKIKALAYFFAFFIIAGQIVKAQCPILNQAPTASPTSICGTGTATISIPSSEVGVSYAVGTGSTIVNGPVAGTGQPMTFTVGPISNTTTYIVGATNGTCTITMTPMVTVTVNPLPTVAITPSHTAICKGAIDTLTASGAINYTWTPGSSTATSLTVAPTNTNTPTSYTLTGTDANGCSNTAVQAITVNPVPTINITNSTFGGICPGGSATLTASGGTTYTWSANAGSATTNTVIVSPTTTTVYTVTGTNASGCSNTKTRTVTVNPSATVTINGPAFVCMGSVATLTASGAATYTWSTGTSGATTSVSPTVTTTYSVVSGSGGGTCPAPSPRRPAAARAAARTGERSPCAGACAATPPGLPRSPDRPRPASGTGPGTPG